MEEIDDILEILFYANYLRKSDKKHEINKKRL